MALNFKIGCGVLTSAEIFGENCELCNDEKVLN
jgi:hypothetical protein